MDCPKEISKTDRLPLTGIRVIEMGAFIAGPYCGQLLGDLGADVIKVEAPGDGDPMRRWGLKTSDGHSLWWPVIGRNKRSITLDLHRQEGQCLARRLIRKADVLLENFKPGTLEKWNLDPEQLRVENPGLVVARVSGFGQTGPYRDRAGFASVSEAMGGLRFLTGYPDRPPTRVGLSIGDSLAGIFAAMGILTALYTRDTRGGEGQVIDLAITDGVLAVLESVIAEYSVTGNVRTRTGPVLPGIAPSNLYPTSDGYWVVIGANSDGLFRKLANAMGQPELGSDSRYASHEARGHRQSELDERIAQWTSTCPRGDLLRILADHGVPSGPVYDAADIANDEHYRSRGAILDINADDIGKLTMQGVVPKLSRTPGRVRWTGPALGQHNAEVYGEILGMESSEIAQLEAERLI